MLCFTSSKSTPIFNCYNVEIRYKNHASLCTSWNEDCLLFSVECNCIRVHCIDFLNIFDKFINQHSCWESVIKDRAYVKKNRADMTNISQD